jgi:hypothetical protein
LAVVKNQVFLRPLEVGLPMGVRALLVVLDGAVDDELAAVAPGAARVVEHVDGPLGELRVAAGQGVS